MNTIRNLNLVAAGADLLEKTAGQGKESTIAGTSAHRNTRSQGDESTERDVYEKRDGNEGDHTYDRTRPMIYQADSGGTCWASITVLLIWRRMI